MGRLWKQEFPQSRSLGELPSSRPGDFSSPAPDTGLRQPLMPADERLAEAAGGLAACSFIVCANLPPGGLFLPMLHLSSCNTWIPEPILSCK